MEAAASPSPLGGSAIATPPRFNAVTSAGSSGRAKAKAKASPQSGSSRRDRREKWHARIGDAAASPREKWSSPGVSAGNTFANSGAGRPFGLPLGGTTAGLGAAGTTTSGSTAGTSAPPTAAAAAAATRTVAASTATPSALPPAYDMRQLLQNLVISTATTEEATAEIPRPSPDASIGSSASDKENGSSSSTSTSMRFGTGVARFGTSSFAAPAAAAAGGTTTDPNPYALPNGAEMVESLIASLPRALNLHQQDDNDNHFDTMQHDDGFELDDIFYREMAEALLRCRIRKRSAPSSATIDGKEPKRADMSPARAAAHAAASARKEKQQQQQQFYEAQGQQNADAGADSDSSWVDVGSADGTGAVAAAAVTEEVSFRSARRTFESADVTTAATTSSSAKVDKEAQFLGRMKIDDEDDDNDGAAARENNDNTRSPEGIVASRVQRLGLDGGGTKKNENATTTTTATTASTTPASKQPKPFGIPKATAVGMSTPITIPATKAAAMSSTPAATVANDATKGGATPGTSKISNLKGMWEGFSSPDPAAAAAASKALRKNLEAEMESEDMDATKTDEEAHITPAANLTGPAVAEARAKEAFARSKAKEMGNAEAGAAKSAAATTASKTDEHGFPDATFPSPNSDDSFDLDSSVDEQALPEMSFFHSPAEKVNAVNDDSVFAFNSPPLGEEQQPQQNRSKIKPLKKPPHTNAKQGKMRRKVEPSANAEIEATATAGMVTNTGEGEGKVDPSSFQFFVDLSKGKDGGARKQGKSKGQRASLVAPQTSVEEDVEMPDTSPPPPQPASRPYLSDEALSAAAAAAAAAANVDPSLKQDFSIGASPRKSPRGRGGRKSKSKLPGFGTKSEAKPLAASLLFRESINITVDASFDSTSGPMPFLDPFASEPASATAEAAPRPPSIPATAPSEGQAAHIAALRDQGRELYLERRYQESVVRYSSALRIRTCNFTLPPRLGQNDMLLAQILGNRAAALLMVGAYDAAASDCRRGLQQIPDVLVWDLKADSGPALRSRLLGRMGRALLKTGKVDAAEEAFDATIRIADETFAKYGREYIDPKAANLLDQSIADATLNKTDARRLREEKSEINKHCSGLPPNVAAQTRGPQILAHVKTALELAPGDIELHSHTVQLFAYMERWADLALHCERFASDCVKYDGVFVDDLTSLNPYPSAPLAQTLKGDHFDLSVLDAVTNAPKLLSEDAVGEAVRRMPISMLPHYLRALRLEERYAEAQRAASVLLACAREGALAGCPTTWLEREQKKRIRTCTTKDTGDALFRKGQYEEAAAKYAACLLVDGEGEDIATTNGSNAGGRLHAVLHCNRAACFMATKQYREAAKECTAALRIHTLYMKAMLRRARCHSRLQRHEEAVSEYQHWISIAEAAARNPQSAAAEYAAACYFDKPSDTTPEDIEKARIELNEALSAKNSQEEAEANARARAQRQKWYDDNLRSGGGVGGGAAGASSDAQRRKQQWYESAGSDGSRRWDTFNGSSPKKPGGNAGRSYSHRRSPPRAEYQQQQRSQSHQQQQAGPTEGNPKGRTHYEVLGVSRNATVAQIKKAYRKMALKYHPDKGGSDEDFLPVQQAYDTLSDESSRRKYDNDMRYGRF